MSHVIAAYDPCGCCASVCVLEGYEADAYADAAEAAKAGRRVETVDIEVWRARSWHCPDHPEGPPWWESNGGNGKVPTEYQPQQGLGL